MTKSKQKSNPKFGFLYGGEYYNYYIQKVNSEQASKFFLIIFIFFVVFNFIFFGKTFFSFKTANAAKFSSNTIFNATDI